MKELQKKQRIRRIVYSIPSLVFLSIIAFFLTKGAITVMEKERESSRRSRELEGQASVLTLREQELRDDITLLQTEEGIKDEIKERFSVTQEGEYLAVIVDDKRVSSSTNNSALPWYKRLLTAIMGNK